MPGSKQDRDENAAINILVAGGQSETKNGRGGKGKTTAKVAAVCVSEALRQQNVNLPRSFGSIGISAPLGRGGCQHSSQSIDFLRKSGKGNREQGTRKSEQ
ncbi:MULTISPECIES: hypothetical protein [Okeania]|uniref:hypothetical protein n=1 Tax=Okeania TaxID=1458928 RepID=UPI00105F16D3|nr:MULTISPECIES: hypothetical protein [Okeania]NET14462.1 hypothetical protein [Okeania sp. SIO1H6]NES79221.1 hypothetical protein [Okeania sp. SIO1H4]NES90593.1 hypothetical protein [Okeania sp. SIO2B9]NET22586.1 hypothetical protein [Okeania sp. SIO1H5]NET79235.1 hypothetical protein [Okeania sp. SIO1F9]